MANEKITEDPRIDPRIKAIFGMMPAASASGSVPDRETLLAEVNTEAAQAAQQGLQMFMEMCDNEDIAPSAGLTITDHTFTSQPDGNPVKVQFIRPESSEPLACVYYIHGGGMQSLSCYLGNYRAWGKIIAAQGVAVAMVDFRNALTSPLQKANVLLTQCEDVESPVHAQKRQQWLDVKAVGDHN